MSFKARVSNRLRGGGRTKRILSLMLVLAAMLLVISACVSEVDRDSDATPTTEAVATVVGPSATATPTSPPPPTTEPTSTTEPILVTESPPSTPTVEATTPPASQLILDVRAPRDGSTVRTDAVVVFGSTLPGAFVDIDGIAAEVGPDGRFQLEVALIPGLNAINIVATDSNGRNENSVLNVTSLALPPQPFLLIVTEPEDQSIVNRQSVRLSGRTGPDAIASVNGVSVPVDELGFFFTSLGLEPGPNIIDVVATNDDGTVLSTVLALIYRP